MIQNLAGQSCTGAQQSFMGLGKALGGSVKLYGACVNFMWLGKVLQGLSKALQGKALEARQSPRGFSKALQGLGKALQGLAKL